MTDKEVEDIIRSNMNLQMNLAGIRADFEEKLQRTWVGLTDEEIKALASWWPSYDQMPALMVLAKDIQNSLKEKNT